MKMNRLVVGLCFLLPFFSAKLINAREGDGGCLIIHSKTKNVPSQGGVCQALVLIKNGAYTTPCTIFVKPGTYYIKCMPQDLPGRKHYVYDIKYFKVVVKPYETKIVNIKFKMRRLGPGEGQW